MNNNSNNNISVLYKYPCNSFQTTQPYIIRKIGQRWGTDGESHNFVEHIVSNLVNSVTTIAARTLADEIRITAWEASPRGIQWAATQAALQLFNPRKETKLIRGSILIVNGSESSIERLQDMCKTKAD